MNKIKTTATVLGAALALVGGQAIAGEEPAAPPAAQPAAVHGAETHGAEAHQNRYIIGAKGSYLAAFSHGDLQHLGGGGLFFEMTVVPHMLAVEARARFLTDGHVKDIPVDLLLKVPWHVSHTIQVFGGAGPTVVVEMDDETSAHGGLVVALGAYTWVHPHIALVMEANYNLVFKDKGTHGLGANAGIAYGW